MAETQGSPAGSTLPFVIGGAILVALTTPFNLMLLLVSWSLISATAGSYAADNSGGGLILLGGIVNVGLFLILCGFAELAFRRRSLFWRRAAIFVVLVLHLGLWLGWSFAVIAQMAATGVWL